MNNQRLLEFIGWVESWLNTPSCLEADLTIEATREGDPYFTGKEGFEINRNKDHPSVKNGHLYVRPEDFQHFINMLSASDSSFIVRSQGKRKRINGPTVIPFVQMTCCESFRKEIVFDRVYLRFAINNTPDTIGMMPSNWPLDIGVIKNWILARKEYEDDQLPAEILLTVIRNINASKKFTVKLCGICTRGPGHIGGWSSSDRDTAIAYDLSGSDRDLEKLVSLKRLLEVRPPFLVHKHGRDSVGDQKVAEVSTTRFPEAYFVNRREHIGWFIRSDYFITINLSLEEALAYHG